VIGLVANFLGGAATGSAASGGYTLPGSTQGGSWLFGSGAPSFMAEGGFVTGPTKAVIGEGSQPEYVVPASKMGSAMARWNAGMRGDAVVNGADSTGNGGGVSGGGITLNVTATRIADDRWVKVDDLQVALAQTRREAAQDGAKQGEARALRRLQMSPGTRKKVGM